MYKNKKINKKKLNENIKKTYALTSLGYIEWKTEDEESWWWKYRK